MSYVKASISKTFTITDKQGSAESFTITDTHEQVVAALATDNHRILAIKFLRAEYGLSLHAALAAVDYIKCHK